MGRLGLLAQRDFRMLWTGDTISQLGTQVSLLAVPLVAIKTLHASTFEVGLLTAAETAAFLLIGLPAGAWVDRVRRRPVMVAGDVGRALLLGSVPLTAALGVLTIWQLFVVALLAGALTVFFDVAYQSYLPSLVTRDELVEGNSKLEASRSVSMIVGPTLGGFLVQLLTAPYAVLVDAASFGASAGFVTGIAKAEPAPERPAVRSLRREVSEGLRFVLGHRLLRAIAATTGASNLFSGVLNAVVLVFLVRTLHLSAGAIGVLFSIASVGGLAGALFADRVSHRLGAGRTIWLSLAVTQPFVLVTPLTERGVMLAVFAASQVAVMFGVVVYNVAQVSFRQALCPPRLLGRMNATMRFLVWGTMPIGGVLGGMLGQWLGLRPALWVASIGMALAWLPAYLSPLRRMRDLPAYEEPTPPPPTPVGAPAVAPPG